MNTVDVIVVLVLLLNGVVGAFKGFVWQALRLGGIVLGFLLARSFGPDLAAWSEEWIEWDPTGRRVIGYVAVFAGTYLLVGFLAHLSRGLIDKARLASADRSLGFLLGSAKGLLLVWIAFYFVLIFFPVLPDYAQVQLRGDPERNLPPSRTFVLWNEWVRDNLNDVMPGQLQREFQDARRYLEER